MSRAHPDGRAEQVGADALGEAARAPPSWRRRSWRCRGGLARRSPTTSRRGGRSPARGRPPPPPRTARGRRRSSSPPSRGSRGSRPCRWGAPPMPAFTTTRSMRPRSRWNSRNTAKTASASVTSSARMGTRRPGCAASSSALSASSRSTRRAQSARSRPSRANSRAMPRPRPALAPVTRMTFRGGPIVAPSTPRGAPRRARRWLHGRERVINRRECPFAPRGRPGASAPGARPPRHPARGGGRVRAARLRGGDPRRAGGGRGLRGALPLPLLRVEGGDLPEHRGPRRPRDGRDLRGAGRPDAAARATGSRRSSRARRASSSRCAPPSRSSTGRLRSSPRSPRSSSWSRAGLDYYEGRLAAWLRRNVAGASCASPSRWSPARSRHRLRLPHLPRGPAPPAGHARTASSTLALHGFAAPAPRRRGVTP